MPHQPTCDNRSRSCSYVMHDKASAAAPFKAVQAMCIIGKGSHIVSRTEYQGQARAGTGLRERMRRGDTACSGYQLSRCSIPVSDKEAMLGQPLLNCVKCSIQIILRSLIGSLRGGKTTPVDPIVNLHAHAILWDLHHAQPRQTVSDITVQRSDMCCFGHRSV